MDAYSDDSVALPVAPRWFVEDAINAELSVITEPHVHPFLRSNIWHLRGRDRDLIVDTGLGVGSLRRELPHVFLRDPVVVVTHGHLDHVGGAHEFDECLAHPAERIERSQAAILNGPALTESLGLDPTGMPGPLPQSMLSARPTREFSVEAYRLQPVARYTSVSDGAVIDLGDRRLQILHLPGHTPGSIALYDESDAALFSGDVVYGLDDGDELLDEIRGPNIDDYVASLRRIASMPIQTTYPGHGAPLDPEASDGIIRHYVCRRTTVT